MRCQCQLEHLYAEINSDGLFIDAYQLQVAQLPAVSSWLLHSLKITCDFH